MIHRHEFWEKATALFARAEAVDHPGRHVVDRKVGGGRYAGRGELFENERGIQPAEPAAAELLADANPGEAQLRRSAQRHDWKLGAFIPARRLRQPFLAGKRPRRFLERPLLVRKVKIHGGRLWAAKSRRQPLCYRERQPFRNCSRRSNCDSTALQRGGDARPSASGWALARKLSAKRDLAAFSSFGLSEAAAISPRITFAARTSRSSSMPQRWALPSSAAPVSAMRAELAAAAAPVATTTNADVAKAANRYTAGSKLVLIG